MFERRDWRAARLIIEPVFRSGETYAFSPEITEEEAYRVWVVTPSETFEVIGTLTKVFRHSPLGLVDAYVMYKQLET